MFVSDTRMRIAALLDSGLSMAEVARRTGLAYTTVSYHRARLLRDERHVREAADDEVPPERFLIARKTREEVHGLLAEGRSRAEVARRLGLSKSTVTYHARRFGMSIDARAARRYDWKVIQRYYDAGHTLEQCRARFGFSKAAWTGAVRRGAIVARPRAMPIDVLLAAPRARHHLKRRLLSAGLLEPICRWCGLEHWRGVPLALQLHHLNGDRHDNRLVNLALLCPNCHSQTDTWAGRNPRRGSNSTQADHTPDPAGARREERAA